MRGELKTLNNQLECCTTKPQESRDVPLEIVKILYPSIYDH